MNDKIEGLRNETFAITCIKELFASSKMNGSLLNILLNKEACERFIQAKYRNAILKEVDPQISYSDLKIACLNGTSIPRYYDTIIFWDNRAFIVTNYWYGPTTRMPDNRTPFLQWIKKQL